MMEILPKSKSEIELDVPRQRRQSQMSSYDTITEQLEKIRKSLLLRSNKNVSRYTIRTSWRLTDDQMKTIASLLPDEVIHHTADQGIRKFEASVLFADVSGFTDLSEKYQTLENGASKLSMILNFYIGTMVQEILSHGGDIIKYAGDAFIATFRAENELTMQDAIQRAIDSALIIQRNCSNFQTDFDNVTLNVKIAISGGEVYFSFIGNELSAHYAIVGDPVWQVKSLQNNIKPGDILVTPKAWFYAQESLYLYRYNRDKRHYKVMSFKSNLNFAERQHEAILNFYEMKKKLDEDQSSISQTFNEPSIDPFYDRPSLAENESYSLRQDVNTLLDNKSRKFLRRFIIRPVINSIDLNEPIENLTEMRNVVIIFANFVIAAKSSVELIRLVDEIYKSLCTIVTSHEGIVNKVSLFDKDTMFLIVFGLRGLKHELESRIALRCASELLETFKPWPEIPHVSLGVTAGMSYCGIVGHTLRREYSVLSVTVNKAARLMMAYPDIVSCDQEALLKSKMDLKHFTILPKVNMKGLRGEVFAYEFREVTSTKETDEPKQELPILGRDDSLVRLRRVLNAAIYNFNQGVRQLESIYQKLSCVVIKGDTQQGKTRMLDELHAKCFDDGLQCLRVSLCSKDLKTPFGVASKIFRRALMVTPEMTVEEIQEIVLGKFKGFNVDSFLSLLNSVMRTNFAATQTIQGLNRKDSATICQSMLKVLAYQTFSDFCVIFIDDFEFMDQESLELLENLLDQSSIFMFVTLGPQRNLSEQHKSFLDESFVASHRLEPIEPDFLSEIACNCLGVSAISIELEKYLLKNSNGNPGWIETCVKSLLQAKKLEIQDMTKSSAMRSGKVLRDQTISETSSSMQKERTLFDRCYQSKKVSREEGKQHVNVATLKNIQLQKEAAVYERADHELMIYDSLSSYEQLVCKCGSALGIEFKRAMLSYVLSNSTERMVGRAVMKLLELGIFACNSSTDSVSKSIDTSPCKCENLKIYDSLRDLPSYASCSTIRFQREGFRDVVYNLLTEKQRLEFHRKALLYLHAQTRRCDSCGNRQFREIINEDLDFNFHDGVARRDDTSYENMIKYFDSINFPITTSTSGLWKSFKLRPMVLNYMNFDFHNCKCESILYKLYSEMLTHCVGPELFVKLIDTKVELASKCIKVGNIPRASALLQRALFQVNLGQLKEDSRLSEYFTGRILTLQGNCSSKMMQEREALNFYYKSCKAFCVSFPRTFDLTAKIKLAKLIRDIKSSLKMKKVRNCSRLFSLVTLQLSKTLNLMFDLLFDSKNFELAMLAAFWALRSILKFNRTLAGIARSFANALRIVFFTGRAEEFRWLQHAALVQTARTAFMDDIELEGLTWVIKMYHALMLCQCATNNLRLAVKVGDIAANLCSKVQLVTLETDVVPLMYLLLLNSQRIEEAFALLQSFGTYMKLAENMNGLVWYFASSLDLLLETSLTAVSYEECDLFFLQNISNFHQDSTQKAQSRFFANMLLWSVRHGIYEMAQIWSENLMMCFHIGRGSSLSQTFTGLRLMEALTIQLFYAIEDKDETLFSHFETDYKHIEQEMRSAIEMSKCFKERFDLHRMHFKLVTKFDAKTLKKLKSLKEISIKKQNFTTLNLVRHSERVWRRELPADIENFWLNHSKKRTSLNLAEISLPAQIFPFSLPIPKSEKFQR